MAARLSSTGISHHNLLPHILSIRLSTVNSSPHPRIVSQSLHSSSQPRCLAGDLHPCPGYVWLWQELSDPFRLPQISCFPLSLFWLRQLPQRGVWTPGGLVPPPAEGRSSPTDPPVFPPSSFILLSFAWFWIFFPLVRYCWLLSAAVLHALLCLMVCSWCIHGERDTPRPPTPLPSHSPGPVIFFTVWNHSIQSSWRASWSWKLGMIGAFGGTEGLSF